MTNELKSCKRNLTFKGGWFLGEMEGEGVLY